MLVSPRNFTAINTKVVTVDLMRKKQIRTFQTANRYMKDSLVSKTEPINRLLLKLLFHIPVATHLRTHQLCANTFKHAFLVLKSLPASDSRRVVKE